MNSGNMAAVALDCERVKTRVGDEAVRVCVVDESLNTLLKTYVKPENPIINYRIHITGIHKEDLVGAPSLEDVRSQVKKLIKGRLLVGQSPHHALEALDLHHYEGDIRDTARLPIFLKPDGGARKLRDLSEMYLNGLVIQKGHHDPEEDARTAMMLFLKCWNLPGAAPQLADSEDQRQSKSTTIKPVHDYGDYDYDDYDDYMFQSSHMNLIANELASLCTGKKKVDIDQDEKRLQ